MRTVECRGGVGLNSIVSYIELSVPRRTIEVRLSEHSLEHIDKRWDVHVVRQDDLCVVSSHFNGTL